MVVSEGTSLIKQFISLLQIVFFWGKCTTKLFVSIKQSSFLSMIDKKKYFLFKFDKIMYTAFD